MSTTGLVCKRCTFQNHSDLLVCEICEYDLRGKKRSEEGNVLKDAVDELEGNSMTDCKRCKMDDTSIGFNSAASTVGLVEALQTVLTIEKATFSLCSPCAHITQKGFDGHQWSCGYRNIQMLCSSLLLCPQYGLRMFSGAGEIPDIHGIQSWIEKAWAAGFDVVVSDNYCAMLYG